MSWKSFACVAALSALIASPAVAVPTIGLIDNMDGTATLQVTVTGTGSIAAEIFVSADFDLTAAVITNALAFDTANPGNNPFTSDALPGTPGITTGLSLDLAGDQLFASYGTPMTVTGTLDFLTIDYDDIIGGTISASGLVAEGGVNFTGLSAMVVVPPAGGGFDDGDFDMDGDVDGVDLGVFAFNFGMTNSPPPFLDGDFDMDGDVDGVDLGVFAFNFGNGVPATAVPEPASFVLISLALVGFAGRRFTS